MQRNKLRNLMENLSKINQKTSFLRAPNPIAFLTRFWEHFARSWGPFASISAVLEPPEALPEGLLGRLVASWGASGPPNLNFGRFWASLERSWSHFGTILEPFWTPGTPFWTFRPSFWSPRCPIWEAFPSLHASKPPSLQASSGLGGIREA